MKPGGSRSRAAPSVGDGTLSGQVALVTGGARGLGMEVVRALEVYSRAWEPDEDQPERQPPSRSARGPDQGAEP